MSKCGDKDIAALKLHGVKFLDPAGDSTLVKPLLPLGVSLDVTQVNDL